ncbi:hypothetical protein [Geomesophilobacter sediminis]|uniref:Uncharacterized protein n=1 Tax=Geomesophilobacter sediminis TaxID=2798584 RepID=A0A8J7LWE2_9BACT|nr:hypothetical protein [Geomesophilobacter sediminis]MBJ6725650.1 hypothetical protein [Geomesophilobacter sediminis]
MEKEKCGCGVGHETSGCGSCADNIFRYWCETCGRAVAEKRCPFCGLKARSRRPDDRK